MNRIKQLRLERQWTQMDLANKLSCAISSIAMYETGYRKPSLEVLIKLSEIFNCSIDYLLYKSEIRTFDKDKDDQNFHSFYHKEMDGLTQEEIADALRFYKEMKKRVSNKSGH